MPVHKFLPDLRVGHSSIREPFRRSKSFKWKNLIKHKINVHISITLYCQLKAKRASACTTFLIFMLLQSNFNTYRWSSLIGMHRLAKEQKPMTENNCCNCACVFEFKKKINCSEM